jgi:hypothetical protein
MKTKFLKTYSKIYDGTQLEPLWIYLNHKILGDAIVSFVAPCNVHFDAMIDGEDFVAGSEIRGDLMLHFLVEKFDATLLAGVSLQRLLSSLACDLLNEIQKKKVIREGDDLYVGKNKLSISIATACVNSALIHFAVNVVNTGTPVATTCLKDLKIKPEMLAKELMARFSNEVKSIVVATQKVRTF